MDELHFPGASAWRAWLKAHHAEEEGLWLVFYKKETGVKTVDYSDALDAALCYGWIDGIVKKIADARYGRKFTPRKPESKWSPENKRRVERLMREKRMAAPGRKAAETAKANGSWDKPDRPTIDGAAIDYLRRALGGRRAALAYFDRLAPSHQKRYTLWIASAKRPETRRKRIEEAAALLERKEKLGLR